MTAISTSPARLRAAVIGLLFYKMLINTTQRAIYPFLPAIARGLGISLPAAGALVSVRWATGLITPFLVGSVGKRRSPAALMVLGALLFTVGALVTAATGVFVGAAVGFGLLGLAKPMFDIGATAFVSDRVPFERRARVIGTLELSWAGGLLVGAPTFGWMIDRYDWTTPFAVAGVLGALGAIVVFLRTRQGQARAAVATQDEALRLDRNTYAFLAAVALLSAAVELTLVVLGEWLEIGFDLTLLALGGVGTLLGLAELIAEGGVMGFTDRLGARRAMQIGSGGMVVGFALLALTAGSLWPGVTTLVLTTLLFEFAIVSSMPLATEMRPRARTRFLALFLVATAAGRIVADWTGPAFFEVAGMEAVALVGGVVSWIALLLVTGWVCQPLPEPASEAINGGD